MAELYLYANDNGSYKKGDIVDILDDGVYGGKQAKMPSFFIVSIPDKSKRELQYLKDPVTHEEDGQLIIDLKRKYYCDYVSVIGQSRIDEITSSEEWEVDDVSLDDIQERTI